jgi:TPR repeat protein
MSRSNHSGRIHSFILGAVVLAALAGSPSEGSSQALDEREECVTQVDGAESTRHCEAGDWAACLDAGVAYGDCGTPAAFESAARLLGRACEHGSPLGCRMLGGLYSSSTPVHDVQAAHSAYLRAAKLFQRDCEEGQGRACSELAGMIKSDQASAPMGATASQLMARAGLLHDAACIAGRVLECRYLAELYATQGDDVRAKAAYLRACEAGDPNSCCVVGVAQLRGERPGTKEDAREYLKRACVTGDLECCSWAGAEYERGDDDDRTRAVALYELACSAGKAFSCYRLAMIYESGLGGPDDSVKAAELFRRACAAGVREACTSELR